MKINWFAIAVIVLFLGAGIKEIFTGNLKLFWFYLFSAAMNYVITFMEG